MLRQRIALIQRVRYEDVPVARAAREIGMSRTTAYKWLRRFDTDGSDEALADRSRRPKNSPRQTPPKIERRLLELHDRHGWPLSRIISEMDREGLDAPSLSTACRILRRAGRVPASSDSQIGEPWIQLVELLICESPPLRDGTAATETCSKELLEVLRSGGVRRRRRAMVLILLALGLPRSAVAKLAKSSRGTVKRYWDEFQKSGIESLRNHAVEKVRKADNPSVRDAVFCLLHSPPSIHGINRTTWRMKDLNCVLREQETPVSMELIREIIRTGGYRWKKAKRVLTSPDPDYRSKLRQIQEILSGLGPDECFFSVDEFGPCAVQMRGGKRLVAPGDDLWIPQRQKSKGSLIVTAALELSSNQVTHFHSQRKNTLEMIKLLEVLLSRYSGRRRLYLSWDAASWHASKALYEQVAQVNRAATRNKGTGPTVELAPLPSRAQFLNVIESVFSGMARAVLHNSDYGSLEEARAAIDRHFRERNAYFLQHPQRAGKKIWGEEQVPSVFSDSHNCKNPRWQH